jgi:hypothetical protein
MEYKKLYAFGDSWTDDENDTNHINWTYLVSDMLQMQKFNFGMAGCGNWRISQTIMERLLIKDIKPDCAMILWSETSRVPFGSWSIRPNRYYRGTYYRQSDRPQNTVRRHLTDELERFYELSKSDQKIKNELYTLFEWLYRDFIHQILYISRTLEDKNIPYIMAQAFHPHISASVVIPYNVFNVVWDKLIKEYDNKIPKNVLGWPFVKEFGGWSMAEKFDDNMFSRATYHPNKSGHLFIADEMLNGYHELYE